MTILPGPRGSSRSATSGSTISSDSARPRSSASATRSESTSNRNPASAPSGCISGASCSPTIRAVVAGSCAKLTPSTRALIRMNWKPCRSFSRRSTTADVPLQQSTTTLNDFSESKSYAVGQVVEVRVERARVLDEPSQRIPLDIRRAPQVVEVEQLAGLGARQIPAVRSEELQRVPVRVVVARADRDAAGRADPANGVLHHRRGRQAEVDHVAARGEQRRQHGLAEHDAAGARVAAQHDGPARREERRKGRAELQRRGARETRPDDAADAGGGDAKRPARHAGERRRSVCMRRAAIGAAR